MESNDENRRCMLLLEENSCFRRNLGVADNQFKISNVELRIMNIEIGCTSLFGVQCSLFEINIVTTIFQCISINPDT